MRLIKVLLLVSLLGSGSVLASQDSISEQKPEPVPADPADYAAVIPSESSEAPG